MLLRLITSNFASRKARLGLTVAAVALSVRLVVSVTSGFATIEKVAQHFLGQIMGTTDATILRESDTRAGVSESLVKTITADPEVQTAYGRLETDITLLDAKGNPLPGRPAQAIGVRMPGDREVGKLQVNAGQWFDTASGHFVVIDQVVAETLHLAVGDTLNLPGLHGNLPLKVSAIVHKPGILATQIQTIYLPLETLQKYSMPNNPGRIGKILIDLKPGVDGHAFDERWTPKLKQIDPSLKLKLTSSYREDIDRNLQSIEVMSYLGGMVSMLSAAFIVFSALSMGVTERQRTLAMLRAVGAYKLQIAQIVVIEGLVIAILGVAIGVPMGWLWLEILVHIPKFAPLFEHISVSLSRGGLLVAGGGSIVAAVLASLIPAYTATRVDPLDAMRPLASGNAARFPLLPTLVAILLISIDPFILFGPIQTLLSTGGVQWFAHRIGTHDPIDLDRSIRFYFHFFLGMPTIFIGFFLLAPCFVWTTERLLSPLVAVVLGLRPALLRQQVSSGIWRAAGTCAALMVGFAVLIVIQIQGQSALKAWHLPDHFPDVFIFSPVPLSPPEQAKLAHLKGIKPGELMPIAIASPQFGSNLFAIAGAMSMPNATMYFGIDPVIGEKMMELEFRDDEGRRVAPDEQKRMAAEAARLLQSGRYVIVTDEFRQLRGLKRGDKIALKTVNHGTVDYTIAGIVWSPGMDVINSKFDLGRQFEQRTAASLFGSLKNAKEDFGVEDIYLFAANLDYFVERDQVEKEVEKELGRMNMKIGDIRQIKKGMEDGLSNLLLLVSTVAFAAMAVASLGVTNTVMASVRSRQWQFGVLRSIGVTRSQLLRLVIGEAILLGLIGVALGLAAGLEMSTDAHQLAIITLGLKTDFYRPWGIIALGGGVVVLIALLGSLIPAFQVSRSQPLTLLQAGRSAA
jgi:putative ABC transport system permease protein